MTRCLNCMREYEGESNICTYCGYVNGTEPEYACHLKPGEILAERYIVGTFIGFGGFGIIYRAWDTKLQVMVAVKEYFPNDLASRAPGTKNVTVVNHTKDYSIGLERFLGEARTMAAFNTHENIVHIFDFFKENNTAYFVMEYLDGSNLKKYMDSNGIIPVDKAIDIILKICCALESMHADGILHRDINLNNIMICNDNSVKLIDFGAARSSTGELSKHMSIIYTTGYTPPEQYVSKSRQGPWTDIYALSATLYHMVTGKKPEDSMDRNEDDTMLSPMQLNPEIPEWLNRTILKGMATNYELRFKNISEFKNGLLKKKDVLYPQETIEVQKKHRKFSITVSIAFFTLIIFSAITYLAIYHGWFIENDALTMWIPEEGISTSINNAISEYEKRYPGKKIDIVVIDTEEYGIKLNQAAENGELPDIFIRDYLDDKYLDNLANLSSIVSSKSSDDDYLIKKYHNDINKNKYIPLGFNSIVIYENTSLSEKIENKYKIKSVLDISQVELSSDKSNTIYDSSNIIIEKTLAEFADVKSSSDALKMFTDSESQNIPYYIGITDERRKIQDSLAGYSTIYGITNRDIMYAEFSDKISVSKKSFDRHERLIDLWINFLLSREGQKILYLQNSNALPIDADTYIKYVHTIKSLYFLNDYYDNFEIYEYEDKYTEELN